VLLHAFTGQRGYILKIMTSALKGVALERPKVGNVASVLWNWWRSIMWLIALFIAIFGVTRDSPYTLKDRKERV
jgi:hypothetical protein